MSLPFDRSEIDRSSVTASDNRDDGRREDCHRAIVLERVLQFAAQTEESKVERAREELGRSGADRDEFDQVLERVAAGISERLLVRRAATLCHREDVDEESIDAMLELFDLEGETR